MLPLLFLAIVFLFLTLGAIVFILCTLIPPLRRYALSAALWCAFWGPCTAAWLILAGLLAIASRYVMQTAATRHLHLPTWPSGTAPTYAVLAILLTLAAATIAAILHQLLARQMTFALFRIYATLVSAGIGSVFAWCLWFGLGLASGLHLPPAALIVMPFLSLTICSAFGWAAYRHAHQLRSPTTANLSWVTQAEFQGPI
jgi:hypothetical protein